MYSSMSALCTEMQSKIQTYKRRKVVTRVSSTKRSSDDHHMIAYCVELELQLSVLTFVFCSAFAQYKVNWILCFNIGVYVK